MTAAFQQFVRLSFFLFILHRHELAMPMRPWRTNKSHLERTRKEEEENVAERISKGFDGQTGVQHHRGPNVRMRHSTGKSFRSTHGSKQKTRGAGPGWMRETSEQRKRKRRRIPPPPLLGCSTHAQKEGATGLLLLFPTAHQSCPADGPQSINRYYTPNVPGLFAVVLVARGGILNGGSGGRTTFSTRKNASRTLAGRSAGRRRTCLLTRRLLFLLFFSFFVVQLFGGR